MTTKAPVENFSVLFYKLPLIQLQRYFTELTDENHGHKQVIKQLKEDNQRLNIDIKTLQELIGKIQSENSTYKQSIQSNGRPYGQTSVSQQQLISGDGRLITTDGRIINQINHTNYSKVNGNQPPLNKSPIYSQQVVGGQLIAPKSAISPPRNGQTPFSPPGPAVVKSRSPAFLNSSNSIESHSSNADIWQQAAIKCTNVLPKNLVNSLQNYDGKNYF